MKTTYRLGYRQIASVSAVQPLPIPAPGDANATPAVKAGIKPTLAVIQAEGQAVRWRDDGVDPTSSTGMTIPAGGELRYDADMQAIRFIEAVAGAKLNVNFYA